MNIQGITPMYDAENLAYVERRAGEPAWSAASFPRYFEIETVNACNARCPMCTIDDWDRRDGLMKDALFEKIAAEIGDHADVVKRVSLYRDGEPLLDKKLSAKTALIKGYGGIVDVWAPWTGRAVGFEFGWAVGSVHIRRGYDGPLTLDIDR